MTSNSIKKRFVKDYNLPIKIFSEPYFSYFINQYEEYCNSRTNYDLLLRTVNDVGGEENFFKHSENLIQEAIRYVKSNNRFNELRDIDVKELNNHGVISRGDIYKKYNCGKTLVSIDISKANFSSLFFFEPSLFDHNSRYEDFLSKFTEYDYFKKSKKIRQVIFGNLNPKRQQLIQKWIIYNLINHFSEYAIISSSADEIVIDISHPIIYDNVKDRLKEFAIEAPTNFKGSFGFDRFKAKLFHLESVGDSEFFVKNYGDSFEIKNTPSDYFSEVYKTYLGKELGMLDRLTYLNGRLVEFKTPLF